MPRPPCYSLLATSYLQFQLGLWLQTQMGLPLQLHSTSCGPAVGAWCGGAWPLAADLAGCRGWSPGLACRSFFFLCGCQVPGVSLNILRGFHSILLPPGASAPWRIWCSSTVSRALTPGLGDISLSESTEGSRARLSWTGLVCGNVCHRGLLIKLPSGVA